MFSFHYYLFAPILECVFVSSFGNSNCCRRRRVTFIRCRAAVWRSRKSRHRCGVLRPAENQSWNEKTSSNGFTGLRSFVTNLVVDAPVSRTTKKNEVRYQNRIPLTVRGLPFLAAHCGYWISCSRSRRIRLLSSIRTTWEDREGASLAATWADFFFHAFAQQWNVKKFTA